jgi:hypothetical protein
LRSYLNKQTNIGILGAKTVLVAVNIVFLNIVFYVKKKEVGSESQRIVVNLEPEK